MKLDISLGEILVIGSVSCSMIIALGIFFEHVPVESGGVIIVSLCGGAVVAKILKALKKI
jgi:hypothetical protein